jgi:glucose/mannose-6-phosphate isomerase
MLDDLKYIHEKDVDDALGVAEKQRQQLVHDFGVSFQPAGEIRNIVLAGMGGSALPGVFLGSWPGLSVPLEIVRNYNLPAYVDEHTLFISSSHSGNTEETLAALDEAEAKHAQIVVIASGGKLAERAEAAGHPLYKVPTGIQPRMCSFFFLAAFVQLLEPAGLMPKGTLDSLHDASKWLEGQVGTWLADVPTAQNPAKQLAQELMGKSVVVYSGPKLFPAANKWKICMNENAKNVAWCNYLPEFNHNEFIGWSSHPVDKPYAVIELRSTFEHPRVQKRFDVTNRLLSGMRPAAHVVEVRGDTLIRQLLWTANMGDFVSLYLALLNGLNPTPVDLVEKFKVELNK